MRPSTPTAASPTQHIHYISYFKYHKVIKKPEWYTQSAEGNNIKNIKTLSTLTRMQILNYHYNLSITWARILNKFLLRSNCLWKFAFQDTVFQYCISYKYMCILTTLIKKKLWKLLKTLCLLITKITIISVIMLIILNVLFKTLCSLIALK